MSKIKKLVNESSKTEKFLMIVVAIVTISTFLSFIVKEILDAQEKELHAIALIVPENTIQATSMIDGAQLYIDTMNRDKKSSYRFAMDVYKSNDIGLKTKIKNANESKHYAGIIASYDENKTFETLADLELPVYMMTPSSLPNKQKNFYYFIDDSREKTVFIANYMRNIKKEHFTYFAHDGSLECQQQYKEFDQLYKKFEIPLQGSISINQDIKSYFEKVNLGAVYVCGNEKSSEKILHEIALSKTELNTYTSPSVAIHGALNSNQNSTDVLNGIFTTSPLLFDTSNEEAQNFLNHFKETKKYDPDWMSAIFYDMTKMAFQKKLTDNETIKGSIQDYSRSSNEYKLPIKMGQFDGDRLISVPIQLQAINNKHSITNYIQALREGRILYVNNKFMYKTNVVYTGIKINSVNAIKQDSEMAEIDFSIWFRYQGDFKPDEIEFLNSDIVLNKPVEKIDMENDHYVLFRTKGWFDMNFGKDQRSYGSNTINLVYRHKKLNHNNLLFVTDVLGMPSNKEIILQMEDREVVNKQLGWNVTDFYVSQSLNKDLGEGKPQYIGYQGEEPLFSTINVELKIESVMLKATDFIDKKYFIYFMIFGIVGLISARLMDAKQLGRYWYVHSYVLRVIFLPMFFISLGNILLDWAYIEADPITTGYLVLMYESIWWILPAYLVDSAIRRFIWNALEEKAGKKIPAIIVILASFVIYSLAISGIIAFVFHEELTSMLAASGVIAMVVGFAVQANIANIFSGLVLNMDKLFKVGDIIEFDDICGEVVDIGWRTTKIKNWDGVILTLPNDTISNAQIKNISRTELFLFEKTVQLNHEIDPEIAVNLLNKALQECELIVAKDDEYYGCEAIYIGHHVIEGEHWVGRYLVWFTTKEYYDMELAENEFWSHVYTHFKEADIAIC